MARKPIATRRKRRTREHVIADLGVNHVERQMLLAGHTVERISHDYGIDLILFTYNTKGEPEPGQVLIQVKATEQTRRVNNGREIVFRVERADVLTWVSQADPVLLIVYDARADQAWWLH